MKIATLGAVLTATAAATIGLAATAHAGQFPVTWRKRRL
jgi:hypothetical protein